MKELREQFEAWANSKGLYLQDRPMYWEGYKAAHEAAEAIATTTGWVVKYDDGAKTGWVQDEHKFPVLYSEDKAKVMASVNDSYSAHKVKLCMYIDEDKL